ncbi:AER104Wp [Eremothecium gossypii ATCC 10895]|uniref:AER104Wp n=1 Tax=Eremothecium gossypii (strain ATCC 10895 / CBS 109.51 / FGSC 9923 / NRRL Y-1056) TaxID=284811 RepID=Q757A9_EREGS|nr:AER104Wp [Eremothecium gossypii ATCC 10895]AAS52788.1 AER104Wp [Eremothecium gossypii ATCC 10895]AEY97094.1 FAER104Wp [Eremothecium gossypii FDAG1]
MSDSGAPQSKDISESNASHHDGEPVRELRSEIVPDMHPEYLQADSELTADLPEDTTVIDLVHLKIESLEALDLHRFKKLERLYLRQNLIESISEVEVLPAETVEELDLYDNRIKHISRNVNKLVNLKSLDLSFNKIKNIKNIDKLTKLERVYFVQNKIAVIENLNTLGNLKSLELGGNRIAEIGPESLQGLGGLEEIWLGKNSISRLANLQYLKNLKILSIQSNKLRNIEGLDELENLEELYLSHNFIEHIEGLEKNTKLTTLDVTANRLTRIENVSKLTALTDLWASFNKIDQSFESLAEELKDLKALETIYLEGNPIQTKNATTYRRKLVLNLGPSLQKIDATYIRG